MKWHKRTNPSPVCALALASDERQSMSRGRLKDRLLDAAVEKQMFLLGKKTTLLHKVGINEEKIINKIGVARSFKLAKFGSKLDIATQIAEMAIGAIVALGTFSLGVYFTIKSFKDGSAYALSQRDFTEHMLRVLLPKIMPAAITGAIAALVLQKACNYLDIFQHVFLHLVTTTFDEHLKPKAEALFKKFSRESIDKLAINAVLTWIPLPFMTLYRRIRSIKSEQRQLVAIMEMEQFYNLNNSEHKN